MRFPAVFNALRQHCDLFLVLAGYFASYAFYRCALGLPFDIGIMDDKHFLAAPWLKTDLLKSLWYLHAQPPLMNFIAGIGFKLSCPPAFFEGLYLAAGLTALFFLFHTLKLLEISRLSRLAVCLSLCLFPTLFIYQTWAYTPHLELALVAALLYYLAAFYRRDSGKTRALITLFTMGSLLGLLHARWHILVFLELAAIMAIMLRDRLWRRRVIIISLTCLLPLALWYGKNLLLFGFFGCSSWFGANMAQVAQTLVTPTELAGLQAEGDVSHDFPASYDEIKILTREPPTHLQPFAHISLTPWKPEGKMNYNYIGVIGSSQQDQHDALAIIRHFPGRYIAYGLRQIWQSSWLPSLAYPLPPGLGVMLRAVGIVTPGWHAYDYLPEKWRLALAIGSFILYALIPCLMLAISLWRDPVPGRRMVLLCAFYLAASMLVISCFANDRDYVRMRWSLYPVYACFAALSLDKAMELFKVLYLYNKSR